MTAAPFPVTRVCNGPAHPSPIRLPLTPEHWSFYRSGKRAGKPIGRCRLCHHWEYLVVKDGPHGLVDVERVRPLVVELVERCGNPERVADAHGITGVTIRGIVDGKTRSIRKRTVARVLVALSEQRKYDRRNGASERFMQARREQAWREERLWRLAGY